MTGSSIVLRLRPIAITLAIVSGCAGAPADERTVLRGSENRVFLILPLNVAIAMPEEIQHFSPIVWKELELYLRAQRKQLKTVSPRVARTLWRKMIRELRDGGSAAAVGYEDAARALALELRKHAEFDTMIAPSLFVREARVRNQSARWDGVVHEVVIEARGLTARRLVATPFEGTAPAASIHVAAFDARGERLHDGRGGLELLVRVRVRVNDPSGGDGSTVIRPEPTFEFETRTDLFANRARVREGINAAFVPFLPSVEN